jgi:amino acid transporter
MEEFGDVNLTKLSWPQLTLFAYTLYCAGAYGIEQAVSVGGAAGVILALFGFGLVWALPQALIVAELSTAFPKSGSSLYWVEEALGCRWALVNAWCLSLGQIFDAAIWPAMLTSYASTLIPSLNIQSIAISVQFICIILVCIINIAGLRVLVITSLVTNLFTLTPFILFPFVALFLKQTFTFSAILQIPQISTSNAAVFISTILWTFQGLPNIGNLAAEVKNPRKSFPITMSALIILMVLTYGTAVALGVALQPDLTQWQEGYFSTLLATISPWLGVFITLGSTIAMLSGGLTSTAVYSRFIAAAAKEGYIPVPTLGQQKMTRYKTPVPAILLLSCTTFALTNLNFTSLLAVDTTLNVISIVLVVMSYLRLRYIQPDLKRPYEIPGGIFVAWLISIPSLLLSCFAFIIIATSGEAIPVTFAFVLLVVIYIIGYIREKTNACWGRWKYSSSERKRRIDIDIDEEDKENKEDEVEEELFEIKKHLLLQ